MDVREIRGELVDLWPLEGWERYDRIPGTASLPAVVAGLPDRITFEGGTLNHARLELPLILVVPNRYEAGDEDKLLAAAVAAAATYHGRTGVAFRACNVRDIDGFFSVTVKPHDALAAHINLAILAPT